MTLLNEILLIFALAISVVLLSHRLRVPPVVGFLFTGVLVGPGGLGLIWSIHEVELLAEIGVVLLLFSIGVEFSLRSLVRIRRLVFLGGALQVLLTIVGTASIARLFDLPMNHAIFMGFLASLSSTAIVLIVLQERAEVDTPYGRTSLGILIFQDLVIVPMMLLLPVLSGSAGRGTSTLWTLGLKGLLVIVAIRVATKWVVPHLLHVVARTRSREVFVLTIVLLCLAAASATQALGLSLALGAFAAGLILSESEYGQHALGNIVPFRDVFTCFFFVSVGMLLDVEFVVENPWTTLAVIAGTLCLKTLTATLACLFLGLAPRVAFAVGLGLAQVGEFSFVLSREGIRMGLLGEQIGQYFLASSILTMALAPFMLRAAPALGRWADRWGASPAAIDEHGPAHAAAGRGQLVLIGFGLNGKNVARAARLAGIPYRILEINPDTVRAQRARREPIVYGDATRPRVLEHVGVGHARVVVVAISDPAATRAVTAAVRQLNPLAHLIVRTRYQSETEPLLRTGASDVIPEEYETSVEIFARVLSRFLVPRDEIDRLIGEIRSEGYEMLRGLSARSYDPGDLRVQLPEIQVSTLRVPQSSEMSGRTLGALALRRDLGLTVLAIRRAEQTLANPNADTSLEAGDLLVLLGPADAVARLAEQLGGARQV